MKFETPVVEVKKFDLVDVLTTSAGAAEETTTEYVEQSAAIYGMEKCGPL